ncbi:MAG: tyrosine-type recombinase/integrase [Bacteroidota bacterium]
MKKRKLEDYLNEKYSSTSVRGYRNMIKRFCLSLGEKANQASYSDVLEYIGTLRTQKLHPKSLKNNLAAIKIYFNYLIESKQRTDHPCKYLYLKDQIDRQIQVESLHSKETLETLYQNHQSKKEANQKRDQIIISLLIYQALTVLEISQLQVENIDLEASTIFIQANAKNNSRTLNLKAQQIILIHDYLQKEWKSYHRKQTPKKRQNYLILTENGLQIWRSSINRIINQGRKKTERLTALKIRQSVIAQLLKEGNDLRIVQSFAGHRRTASTEAYQQTDLEELKTAIHHFHPLQ